MRKTYLFVLVIFAGILLITACSGILVNTEKAKEEAIANFENGNLAEAEENLGAVLENSADDPEANAAMAFIKFYHGFRNIKEVIEEASNTRTLNVLRVIRAIEDGMTVKEILDKIKTLQDGLDERVIPYFEEALKYAETALDSEKLELKLYPNKVDWDGDGVSEPDKPLKLRLTVPENGIYITIDMSQVYSCKLGDVLNSLGEATVVLVEIDPTGGDAIFNYETFERAALGEDPCEEATVNFNDNDYITIDKGEIYAIKTLVEYMLTYLYPVTIYSFELPDEAIAALQNSVNDGTPSYVVQYLDKDNDGFIEYEEWESQLGDFLKFRPHGEDHLRNELIVIGNSAKDLLNLLDEIAADDDGTETHNLTSNDFIPEDVYTVSEDNRRDVDELVSHTLGSSPVVIRDEDGTIEATLNLYMLRTNPEKFGDLKEFLPKIEYSLETNEATIVEFPDETFGGLIEWSNPPQTPVPLHSRVSRMLLVKMVKLKNMLKRYTQNRINAPFQRILRVIEGSYR